MVIALAVGVAVKPLSRLRSGVPLLMLGGRSGDNLARRHL